MQQPTHPVPATSAGHEATISADAFIKGYRHGVVGSLQQASREVVHVAEELIVNLAKHFSIHTDVGALHMHARTSKHTRAINARRDERPKYHKVAARPLMAGRTMQRAAHWSDRTILMPSKTKSVEVAPLTDACDRSSARFRSRDTYSVKGMCQAEVNGIVGRLPEMAPTHGGRRDAL